MPGKLPALSAAKARAFLERFAPGYVAANGKIKGVNTAGRPYVIELEHNGKMRSDILQRALGYLDVTRDEFWEWYDG